MPGTPCVFLKHWKRYPIAIGNMILARKAAGISNQSSIKQLDVVDGGVILKTEGSKGSVMAYCGSAAGYSAPDGFKLISNGEGYAFYVSNNITVQGLRNGVDSNGEDAAETASIYVACDETPYLYAWNSNGTVLNGGWPGTEMTETEAINGKTFWKHTFTDAPVNIIFNNGEGVQTADIPIAHDSYFTFNPNENDKNRNFTDITAEYYTPQPVAIPACAKVISDHLYVYFRGNLDYDEPYVWAWGEGDKNFCKNKNWPGDLMKHVGKDKKNRDVWVWDAGKLGEEMPTKILFSNCGSPQTADFEFQNGGYYTIFGMEANVIDAIEDVLAPTHTKKGGTYNLNGQRVADNYKGFIIKNGQKFIRK